MPRNYFENVVIDQTLDHWLDLKELDKKYGQ